MITRIIVNVVFGLGLVVSVGSPALAGAPRRYDLQLYMPIPPFEFATPLGIAQNGTVVGYTAYDAFDPSATGVRVPPGGPLAPLNLLDTSYNFPYGINASGQIVGQSGQVAFIWASGQADPLLAAPGYFSGSARDISDASVIVGSVGDSDFAGPQHCVWPSPDVPATILPGLFEGSTTGAAWAVNEAGQIAGVSGSLVGAFFAARWADSTAQPIQIGPLPGAFNSEGLGMNELGDVVGRSSFPDFSIHAFYYDSAGSLVDLEVLPGASNNYSEAFDINDDKEVVGVSSAPGSAVHAFFWNGAMQDLNDLIMPGGPDIEYLARATAINNAGIIAAEAVLGTTGFPRAIAVLTPLRLGDANCDGFINTADAAPLALALVDPAAWSAAFPGCDIRHADVNADGAADGRDVQTFVDCVLLPD